MNKNETAYLPIVDSLHKQKYEDGFFFDFANTAIPVYLFLESQYAPLLQGWYCMQKCYHYLYESENDGMGHKYTAHIVRFANGNMGAITCLIAASIHECIDSTFLKHTYLRLVEDYNCLMALIQGLKMYGYNYRIDAICGDLDRGGAAKIENKNVLESSLALYVQDVSDISLSITRGPAIEILEKYISFLKNELSKLIYEYRRLDTTASLLAGTFSEYKRGNKLANSIAAIEIAGRLKYNQ